MFQEDARSGSDATMRKTPFSERRMVKVLREVQQAPVDLRSR
jgi:hypothetical protein